MFFVATAALHIAISIVVCSRDEKRGLSGVVSPRQRGPHRCERRSIHMYVHDLYFWRKKDIHVSCINTTSLDMLGGGMHIHTHVSCMNTISPSTPSMRVYFGDADDMTEDLYIYIFIYVDE